MSQERPMSSDQGGEPQLQEEAEPGPKTRGEDEITPGTGGDSGVMVSRGLFTPPQQDDRSLAVALLKNRVIGSMIARYIRPSVGSHSSQALTSPKLQAGHVVKDASCCQLTG